MHNSARVTACRKFLHAVTLAVQMTHLETLALESKTVSPAVDKRDVRAPSTSVVADCREHAH